MKSKKLTVCCVLFPGVCLLGSAAFAALEFVDLSVRARRGCPLLGLSPVSWGCFCDESVRRLLRTVSQLSPSALVEGCTVLLRSYECDWPEAGLSCRLFALQLMLFCVPVKLNVCIAVVFWFSAGSPTVEHPESSFP